jgi:hypothetical protein
LNVRFGTFAVSCWSFNYYGRSRCCVKCVLYWCCQLLGLCGIWQINEWVRNIGAIVLMGKTLSTQKPTPVLLFPPYLSHRLTWVWSQALTVRGWCYSASLAL